LYWESQERLGDFCPKRTRAIYGDRAALIQEKGDER